MTSRPAHWHLVDARPRPIAHKSKTNSRSITKIGSRVLHDTCYIAHQFQCQTSRSQAHIVCTSHLCLFLIPETKCCTCVIRVGRGHTVSAEPGGHTYYPIYFYLFTCNNLVVVYDFIFTTIVFHVLYLIICNMWLLFPVCVIQLLIDCCFLLTVWFFVVVMFLCYTVVSICVCRVH